MFTNQTIFVDIRDGWIGGTGYLLDSSRSSCNVGRTPTEITLERFRKFDPFPPTSVILDPDGKLDGSLTLVQPAPLPVRSSYRLELGDRPLGQTSNCSYLYGPLEVEKGCICRAITTTGTHSPAQSRSYHGSSITARSVGDATSRRIQRATASILS